MVMRRPVVVAMSGISVAVVGAALHASQAPVAAARASSAAATIVTESSAATPSPAAAAQQAGPASASPTPVAVVPSHRAQPRATAAPRTAAPSATAAKATAAPSVTVNGAAYDTRYGPVQVQIRVRSGRITAADAVEYPQSEQRDQEINSYAVPQLDQETLDAQSARIDTVSGATYTSDGYRQSLQSAIDAAHKAGAL